VVSLDGTIISKQQAKRYQRSSNAMPSATNKATLFVVGEQKYLVAFLRPACWNLLSKHN